MAKAPRQFQITYGGVIFGDTTREISGNHELIRTTDSWEIEFDFVASAATEALFATEVGVIEAALRKPNQDVVVTFGGQVHESFLHATNTGFNSRAEIIKTKDNFSARISRVYTVRISGELPADSIANLDGRRNSVVSLGYDAARRRTVTISGIWTAVGGSGALLQYESEIVAYSNSVLDLLSGPFDLIGEPTIEFEDTDEPTLAQGKTLTFQRVYRELLYDQGGIDKDDGTQGAKGDPDLADQTLVMRRQTTGPGDVSGADRLVTFQATYDAAVDKSITDLNSKWATIQSWILAQLPGAGGITAVTASEPEFDVDNNRLRGTMTIVVRKGGPIIEHTKTISDSIQTGKVPVPLWDGDIFTFRHYQGKGVILRTVTETLRTTGKDEVGDFFKEPDGGILISSDQNRSTVEIGINEVGSKIEITTITRRAVFRLSKLEGEGGLDLINVFGQFNPFAGVDVGNVFGGQFNPFANF